MSSFHYSKINFNNITLSKSFSCKWLIFLGFPYQIPACTYPFPHTCHMVFPYPSSSPDNPDNNWWSFLLCSLLFYPATSSLLGRNIFLNIILKRPQPVFLPQYRRPRFTPILLLFRKGQLPVYLWAEHLVPRLNTRLFLGPASKIISPLQDMAQSTASAVCLSKVCTQEKERYLTMLQATCNRDWLRYGQPEFDSGKGTAFRP